MELIGCAPADLARGMDVALASEPVAVRLMWRAALTFGMSAMALRWRGRCVEIALDAGRAEVFDDTQHMTARDVRPVQRAGQQHAAVRMRKRKNLRVLRGNDHTVIMRQVASTSTRQRRCRSAELSVEARRVEGRARCL